MKLPRSRPATGRGMRSPCRIGVSPGSSTGLAGSVQRPGKKRGAVPVEFNWHGVKRFSLIWRSRNFYPIKGGKGNSVSPSFPESCNPPVNSGNAITWLALVSICPAAGQTEGNRPCSSRLSREIARLVGRQAGKTPDGRFPRKNASGFHPLF